MPVFKLNEKEIVFPAPKLAKDDGLLAISGDLPKSGFCWHIQTAFSHGTTKMIQSYGDARKKGS